MVGEEEAAGVGEIAGGREGGEGEEASGGEIVGGRASGYGEGVDLEKVRHGVAGEEVVERRMEGEEGLWGCPWRVGDDHFVRSFFAFLCMGEPHKTTSTYVIIEISDVSQDLLGRAQEL